MRNGNARYSKTDRVVLAEAGWQEVSWLPGYYRSPRSGKIFVRHWAAVMQRGTDRRARAEEAAMRSREHSGSSSHAT